MTYPDSDTPPEEETQGRYGFFGTLVGLPTLENRLKEIFMARLDAIGTALDSISTQLTQLSTQIGELTAGQVSQEEIDALVAKAEGIASAVDAAIEPDAGEEVPPPVEEPPTP